MEHSGIVHEASHSSALKSFNIVVFSTTEWVFNAQPYILHSILAPCCKKNIDSYLDDCRPDVVLQADIQFLPEIDLIEPVLLPTARISPSDLLHFPQVQQI